MTEAIALQRAAQAMRAALTETLGPATTVGISEGKMLTVVRATVDAYLRAKIVANSARENGEP
jgi:hypothetical protein